MTNRSVVVKVGTSSVSSVTGDVQRDVLAAIARDVAQLAREGTTVTVVTSGAIHVGWSEVGGGEARPTKSSVLQAVSAVGQPLLMDAWRLAFAEHSLSVGQVLLAPLDFSHRGQYLHARSTLESLHELGVIPIINENDPVADEEIRFGDNDRLAALVANLIGASHLVLLTDTPGLLTADPRHDPAASLIEEVSLFDDTLDTLAGASSSGVGSGGMASKMVAGRMAAWSGVTTVIAAAREATPLLRALSATPGSGTTFLPRATRLSARKAWIAFAVPARGVLVINDGAVAAIEGGGRSLLRVGIHEHRGDFVEGDAVEVRDSAGELVAKGLARVSAVGWTEGDDVVMHRDDLVLLRRP